MADEGQNSSVRFLTYEESALVVVIYTLVSIVATIGNLSVIFIILHFQRMRSPTNYLILNLCLADLLMAALCIPFSYWPILILQRWPFGWVLCKVISFSQAAVVMSSAYTLVAISIDRFIAILCPLNPSLKLTRKRSLLVIATVWLVAGIIACPLLIVMDLMQDDSDPSKWHCVENWSSIHVGTGWGEESTDSSVEIVEPSTAASEAAYHYSVAAMVLQYFLPLVVLIVTYSGIGLRLWYSQVPGEGGKDVMKGRHDSVRKMMPTMFIVTATYAICWCPLNVLNILTGIYLSLTEYRYILYIWGLCHFLAMFNSMANPIIYCSRNQKFRDGFRYLYRWLPCVHYEYSSALLHMVGNSERYTNTEVSAKSSIVICGTSRSSFARFRKSDCAYSPVAATYPLTMSRPPSTRFL